MILCPVCEHAQATGDECDVCGRRLADVGAEAPPVPPVAGLEPTRLPPADAPVEAPLADLEPTRRPAVEVAPALAVDVEPTRAAPVEVAVEETPGLERTAVEPIPGDAPTPEAIAVVCRYCRTPAFPGEVICGNCGMRLPLDRAAPVLPAEERVPVRCPSCGTPNRDDVCTGCGGLVRHR